jgi:hypothetical protein
MYYPHEADDVIAEKHGGATSLENLAWACFYCNRFKGSDLASVEYLCELFRQTCPQWAHAPYYILAVPWWNMLRPNDPDAQAYFRKIAPPAFARRNIFMLGSKKSTCTEPESMPETAVG